MSQQEIFHQVEDPVAVYIGIDPGSSSGGIAAISEYASGNDVCFNIALSKYTSRDLSNFFEEKKELQAKGVKVVAMCEKVNAVYGSSAKAMFAFGSNFGEIQMAMICNKISYDLVLPSKWMKHFGMKKQKEEAQPAWKKRLREVAERLYPDTKMVANTADAVLIAHFCKETHR